MQNKPGEIWEAGCRELFDHANAWDSSKQGMNNRVKGSDAELRSPRLVKEGPWDVRGNSCVLQAKHCCLQAQGWRSESLFALFS